MAYACRIEADSISERGHRLTTMVVTLPRNMLAELNTHCALARNSASSRAIPTLKQLRMIVEDMFIPVEFGTVATGMNAGPPLTGNKDYRARQAWRNAGLEAIWWAMSLVTSAEYIEDEWETWVRTKNDEFGEFVLDIAERLDNKLLKNRHDLLGVSKGLANRILEPFMWHTVIITATEWDNFFNLRTHKDAQLEIRTAAKMMQEAYNASTPTLLQEGDWHLPFIQPHELEWARENPLVARKVSSARCARVSYLTHDTGEANIDRDLSRADGLAGDGHMSPFHHAATPFTEAEWFVRDNMKALALDQGSELPDFVVKSLARSTEFSAKYRGWRDFRLELPNEDVFTPKAA
ncbi:hypothetical protein CL689_05195 [Candidatus Saccharibacteria bacterium]|nr:hypothetical protein [Candidatus Saccharibacteria bacterium]|tara:strand:+ start:2588 stop:3637 length:1050 start_codon:yes stop_codon:yes gene_type:complete